MTWAKMALLITIYQLKVVLKEHIHGILSYFDQVQNYFLIEENLKMVIY